MTILDRLRASHPGGLTAMLQALLIIVPITLAYASLPDQTWLSGAYDQADFDEVVCLLTSALQAIESTVPSEDAPHLALAPKHCLAVTVTGPASAPVYSAPPLRAPPIA